MKVDLNPLKKRRGEKRVIKKFLFFPKTLNGVLRWLEYAYISQRIDTDCGNIKCKWLDISWVSEEEKD